MSLSNRFYEGLCEPYPQEPTRDKFLVVDTDDKGQGVLSLTSFKPGDLVFKFHGNIVDKQTLMTLQIEKGNEFYVTFRCYSNTTLKQPFCR